MRFTRLARLLLCGVIPTGVTCGGDSSGPATPEFVLTQLTAGSSHTCGLTTGGAAYCWGANPYGQLGDGTTSTFARSSPVAVSGGLVFQAISASMYYSTCALTTGGAAYCWGDNVAGQLGDGSMSGRTSPVVVAGGLIFQAISAGTTYACGLTTGGAAYCWGNNSYGQLGDSTTSHRTSPAVVSGGLVFQSISAGDHHGCGLTTGGAAYCWGYNNFGQLGDGTTGNRSSPVGVSGGLLFQAIGGGFSHTCGVTMGGAAHCWGYNNYGQLGDGTTSIPPHSSPVAVSGSLLFQAINAGTWHTCALTAGGAAYCWGSNNSGQLGDGTTTFNRSTPVAVLSP